MIIYEVYESERQGEDGHWISENVEQETRAEKAALFGWFISHVKLWFV